jgi:hypothetical protein
LAGSGDGLVPRVQARVLIAIAVNVGVFHVGSAHSEGAPDNALTNSFDDVVPNPDRSMAVFRAVKQTDEPGNEGVSVVKKNVSRLEFRWFDKHTTIPRAESISSTALTRPLSLVLQID